VVSQLGLRLKAYAKINLFLDVKAKREDGYHELVTVFNSIALADEVTVGEAPPGQIQLVAGGGELPPTEENLAYRAAALLLESAGSPAGIKIHLKKEIPVAAGLGGGSSDAAAVLVAANQLLSLGFTIHKLMELGARLGSDVPFCLLGGTALGRGRGEILSTLPSCPRNWLVLVKPDYGLATARVYQNLRLENLEHPDLNIFLRALETGNLAAIPLSNVLEHSAFALDPRLARLKDEALNAGALKAVLCGSGPTILAAAPDEAGARQLARSLEGPNRQVWVTHTL